MVLEITSRTENIGLSFNGVVFDISGTASYLGGKLQSIGVNVYLKEGNVYYGSIHEDGLNTNMNVKAESDMVVLSGEFAELKAQLASNISETK